MAEQLLKQILTEIQALKVGQEKMAGGMNELKTDVHTLLIDVQKLKSEQKELYSLEHRQEETSAQLNAMAEELNRIKGTVTKMAEVQQQHQLVLDALCRRSIEQEETLRRVKGV